MKELGVLLKLHTANHPQSAGLMKRKNGTVKQQLIKAMETTGKPWPACLHLVKTSIYTTACGKHKLTPFECIFHRT